MMRLFLVAGLLVALSPVASVAHDHHGSSPAGSTSAKAETWFDPARQEKARSYFTDLPVVAQDGKQRRFFSDVLDSKVVLIYLFYTNCDGTCPVINQKIAGVQSLLGNLLGSSITLISITTDPVRDTPSVVKEYAANFDPRPGWLFLTGEPKDIETIVRRLGHSSPDPKTHVTYLMVGNVPKVTWTKLPPTASETEIAEMLRLLTGDRKG
jgi:protein SCO1